MQLFLLSKFRRTVGLAVLLFFAIPFGISITGCGHHSAPPVYCNGLSSGPQVGQVAFITLSPTLATNGESLSYGQQGQTLSASATDCKGTAVSVSKYVFASSNPNVADINPNNGQICAGLWNHNTGGGVADYTTCIPPANPPASNPVVYVTATAEGAVSNSVPVYIHAPVTSIVLGQPSTNCTTDPATNCNCANGTVQTPTAPAYDQASCVSQGQTRQLVARVYANNSQTSANNITCQVGHLTFAAQSAASVLNIDENGVATANQPGSTIVTASVANSSSAGSAGFFSTCPPASIVLSAPGTTGNSINVSLNNLTPLTANVYDKNGVQITGVSLEYVSTTPETIPASTGSVTPQFPGSATITAVCQPNTCNPAPFSQTGYLGNGTPLTSNGITVTTPGSSSTVLYMGSTQSQYIYPYDFTTNQPSSLIKLVFVPNSMVMAQTGATIFLGSPQGMMEVSTASNSQTSVYTNIQGTVLAVSPDGTTVVVTDPARQTISLVNGATGAVNTQYNGVGTSAQFTPDNQTVYITTTTNTLLVHNAANNWQTETTDEVYSDVAVTVPAVGAYFAGRTSTEGRSYCPSILSTTAGTPPSETDEFAPLADNKPTVVTDQLAATTDGVHILGASASPAVLTDIVPKLPASSACPATVNPGYFSSTVVPHPLASVTANSITGVVPATNSALAFVTYTGASGLLPEYVPNASGTGAVSYITLGNGATAASAPVAGVFSTDNLHFYAGTSGDNQVHLFSINGTTATETGVISTKLPCSVGSNLSPTPTCADGTVVAPNLISQRPKKSLD